eukprot:1744464-Rhodomonas_salina.1
MMLAVGSESGSGRAQAGNAQENGCSLPVTRDRCLDVARARGATVPPRQCWCSQRRLWVRSHPGLGSEECQ